MFFIILTTVVQSNPATWCHRKFDPDIMLILARCCLNNSFCHYCCFQVCHFLHVSVNESLCVSFGCTVNVSICFVSHCCRLTNQFDELNTHSITGMLSFVILCPVVVMMKCCIYSTVVNSCYIIYIGIFCRQNPIIAVWHCWLCVKKDILVVEICHQQSSKDPA